MLPKEKITIFLNQLIKFGIVGVLNTLLTLAIIWILAKSNVNYIASNFIGYAIGICNSFILNKIWTFKSKGNTKKEAVLFLSTCAIGYGVQLIALIGLKEWLKIQPNMAQLIAMVVYTMVNFLLNRFWVYR